MQHTSLRRGNDGACARSALKPKLMKICNDIAWISETAILQMLSRFSISFCIIDASWKFSRYALITDEIRLGIALMHLFIPNKKSKKEIERYSFILMKISNIMFPCVQSRIPNFKLSVVVCCNLEFFARCKRARYVIVMKYPVEFNENSQQSCIDVIEITIFHPSSRLRLFFQ